jgi:hypothetical protein
VQAPWSLVHRCLSQELLPLSWMAAPTAGREATTCSAISGCCGLARSPTVTFRNQEIYKRVYDVLMEPLFLETQKVFDDYQRYIGAIKKLVVFKEQPTRRFRTPFPSLLRRSGTLATQSLFPMVIMYLLLQRVSLLSFRRSCWSCGESNILQGMSRHTSISTCASQRPSEYA